MTVVAQAHQGFTFADPFLTDSQKRAMSQYAKLKAEAERNGWQPASVISMHAFSWPVTGPTYPANVNIQAVPISKEHWLVAPKILLPNGIEAPYTQHVFTEWKPTVWRYYEGQQTDPEMITGSGHIWPIDQARDAVVQNKFGGDRGGVFCYEGAHRPGSERSTAAEELTQFAEAHAALLLYYQAEHEKYLDAWQAKGTDSWKNRAGKGKYHRWIAHYLFNIGKLENLPLYCQEYVSPNESKRQRARKKLRGGRTRWEVM